ncbi:MAG: HlyC/CorC family transporter [Chloroflexi bacterium]|nr:HlyC/CorC family transporter [Chloroflexota bacterium]
MLDNIGLYITLFIIALIGAAFFCSAETAFISLQKLRIHHLVRTTPKKAELVAQIAGHPEKFLGTVLLAINLLESAVATLGTVIAISLWGENLGAAIATLAIAVVTLIFAEYLPKTIAARYAEKIVMSYARPVQLAMVVLSPFVYVLNRIGMSFSSIAGDKEPRPTLSEEEFRTAITVGEHEGVIENTEAEMIHKVFEFGDRPVREVMTPRTEVTFVEKGTRLKDFIASYPDHPQPRFPVFEGSVDNVIGQISIKDMVVAEAEGKMRDETLVDELVSKVMFIPESKRLGELLTEMQDEGHQLAVVIDEFGGTAGTVTVEQVVGAIVGSLGGELVGGEKEYEAIGENVFLVEGGLRVEDANEQLGLNLPEGDYETVAGFIFSLLGRIPREGEQLAYKGMKITVSEMRGRKLEKVMFTKMEAPAKAAAPAEADKQLQK